MTITSEKKAKEVIIECLDEMYQASKPPITWEEILKKYQGRKNWFLLHRITEETYMKIKEKHQRRLHKMYHGDLDWMLLDYSPAFVIDKKRKRNEKISRKGQE